MGRAVGARVSADRFVEAALDLIAERGGSTGVNLRQISRRIGCAHTNAYNYFGSYDDLLWAAFERALVHYAAWLEADLSDELAPSEYLRTVLGNLATFPQEHPGWYRFVATDQMPTHEVPAPILETVGSMKSWLAATLAALSPFAITDDAAATVADIVLAYVDGETLSLINQRIVPGENVSGRIVDNALRIYHLLVNDASKDQPPQERQPRPPYPKLDIAPMARGD